MGKSYPAFLDVRGMDAGSCGCPCNRDPSLKQVASGPYQERRQRLGPMFVTVLALRIGLSLEL